MRTLAPGSTFWIGPDRFRLIYVNSCRAYVQARGQVVLVDGRRFARHENWNISPNTQVEI